MSQQKDNSKEWLYLIYDSYANRRFTDEDIDGYCESDLWPDDEQLCSKILKSTERAATIKKAKVYMKNRLKELNENKENVSSEVGLNQSMIDIPPLRKCVIKGCGKICKLHSTCCEEHSS